MIEMISRREDYYNPEVVNGFLDIGEVLTTLKDLLVPGFPTDLMSMFFGATNTKYYQFLTGSLLGLIPGMIPIVLIGDAIANPLSKEFLIPFSISTVLSISAVLLYRVWIKKHKKQFK